MKGRTTWIALGVLMLLGGYIFLFERGRAPSAPGEEPGVGDLLNLSENDIQAITVKNGVALEREKEGWQITAPFKGKADPDEAGRFIREFITQRVDRIVTEEKANMADYGLDKPAFQVELKSGKGAQTILFGGKNPSGNATYVKPANSDTVFLVANWVVDALKNKKAGDLRDKTLLLFKEADVTRIAIQEGGRNLELARAGQEDWKLIQPVAGKAKKEKVTSLLASFHNLKGARFVEDHPKDLAKYGLDRPQAVVSFYSKGASAPHALYIGKKESSGDFYARSSQQPAVMTLYSYLREDIKTRTEDWKEEEKKPEKGNKPPGEGAKG